jgi:Ca2+-transporting ATPase
MKMGIIVKQTKTVETLGSATVICTDKTGTITENKMELAQWYLFSKDIISNVKDKISAEELELISLSMWSSEPIPFDAMEIALHEAYEKLTPIDERSNYKLVHEYPLSGQPPMMTHIFENKTGTKIIATKGAPEAIIACSNLSEKETKQILTAMQTMAKEGFRVLGIGLAEFSGKDYPKTQH